jgi:hypothetical protein
MPGYEPGEDPRYLPLVFGAILVYTCLVSEWEQSYDVLGVHLTWAGLHLYLCTHGFARYRDSPLSMRKKHKNYVLVMFIVLFFSTSAFAFDVASVFVSADFQNARAYTATPAWLEIMQYTFIGCTHLAADGLLVRGLTLI